MKTAARPFKPLAALICVMLFMALAVPFRAHAADDGTLTLEASIGGRVAGSFSWKIYCVGQRNADGDLELYEAYAASGAVFYDLRDEAVKQSAAKLDDFVIGNALTPDYVLVTREDDGRAELTCAPGIYFISGLDESDDTYIYRSAPALVEVIAGEESLIIPKMEALALHEDSSLPDDSSSRPDDDSSAPGGDSSGDDSSSTGGDSSSPDDTSSGTGSGDGGDNGGGNNSGGGNPPLPQTGQLWWPVPVLGAAGLVLIAMGVRVLTKKDGSDEK